LKLALVRPDFAHLWPGITIDHPRNIKAARAREKRFVSLTRFSAISVTAQNYPSLKQNPEIAESRLQRSSSPDDSDPWDDVPSWYEMAPSAPKRDSALTRDVSEIGRQNGAGLPPKALASRLTNADAQEASVILQTHPAAGEKVCDGCDRLSAATRARADCQDEITQ
jgi:hypothetical protein